MFGLPEVGNRHLMGAPGSFHRQAVDEFRAGPAFERAEHDHRPAGTRDDTGRTTGARNALNLADFRQDRIQRAGKGLVHHGGIGALHEMGLIAIAAQEVGQLLAADARQDGGIGDLEAVEMQDRKHGAIPRRIEKLVGVPAGG